MVSISHETAEQTHQRLRGVLGDAHLERLEGTWCFVEAPLLEPATLHPQAVAAVHDGEALSQLVPSEAAGSQAQERFSVFSFHFLGGVDNSGFVGWLASELKQALGTGVVVICGYNSGRGGVYDYWGVPEELGDDALAAITRLAESGSR